MPVKYKPTEGSGLRAVLREQLVSRKAGATGETTEEEPLRVWFLLSSALVFGKFDTLTDDHVFLTDTYVFMGKKSQKLPLGRLFISEIIAWGEGVPM